MRAIRISEWGGPEVLELVDDAPLPEPGDGQLLVRVAHAGVNFADTHQRRDEYLAAAELPLVPGAEVAGVREDTGERVVALCGSGGYAEYATAPGALTFPIPDGIADETALALVLQGLTAWHLYRTAARVSGGESVVVHSAAGGVARWPSSSASRSAPAASSPPRRPRTSSRSRSSSAPTRPSTAAPRG